MEEVFKSDNFMFLHIPSFIHSFIKLMLIGCLLCVRYYGYIAVQEMAVIPAFAEETDIKQMLILVCTIKIMKGLLWRRELH